MDKMLFPIKPPARQLPAAAHPTRTRGNRWWESAEVPFPSPIALGWPAGNLNRFVLHGEGRRATQMNVISSPPGDGFICSCSRQGGYHPQSTPTHCWMHPPPINSVFQGSVCLHKDYLLLSLAPPGEKRAMHNFLLKAPRKICRLKLTEAWCTVDLFLFKMQ